MGEFVRVLELLRMGSELQAVMLLHSDRIYRLTLKLNPVAPDKLARLRGNLVSDPVKAVVATEGAAAVRSATAGVTFPSSGPENPVLWRGDTEIGGVVDVDREVVDGRSWDSCNAEAVFALFNFLRARVLVPDIGADFVHRRSFFVAGLNHTAARESSTTTVCAPIIHSL